MTIIAPLITTNPQTITGGTYANLASLINTRRWRLVVTPTAASTAFTGGLFHVVFGQTNGGLAFVNASIELDDDTDALMINQPLTWSAGQALTFTVEMRSGARSLTIAGATTGNGTFAFSNALPIIAAATNLEIGNVGGNSTFAGTISSFDDTSPEMSWAPHLPPLPNRRLVSAALLSAALAAPPFILVVPAPPLAWAPAFPDFAPRARAAPLTGGAAAPTTAIPDPGAPPLSWMPGFPDAVPRPRCAPLAAGAAAPAATLPNADSPPLAWAPSFPDQAPRARAAPLAAGAVAPVAVIPDPPVPALGWLPRFPDRVPVARAAPLSIGVAGPPFAGGASLTVGAMRVRQNILNALAFSTPLTTFGTDLTFTAAAGTVLTATAHAMINCAGPFTLATTGTLPGGTNGTTLYYCAQPAANTFHLALSAANADTSTFVTMTDGGTGTHTLVRTINTAPLYSTFVSIIERGTQSASPNLPTDSFGNAYAYVSGYPVLFASFPASAVSIAIKIGGAGGNAHTFSTSVGNIGGNQDEVLASGLEIFGARILQDSSVVERPDGGAAIITSNPVTTTAKALLIAVINGNSNVNQENFWIFFDGFVKLPYISAEGDPDPAGYDQVCVAAKLVDIKGTYTFRAQGTVRGGGGPSGGIMSLLAFQAVASDLSPLDWLFAQPDRPHAARCAPLASGLVGPVAVLPDQPIASWLPVVPSAPPAARRAAPLAGGQAAPLLSLPDVPPLSWAPAFPDLHPKARPAAASGAASPLAPIPDVPPLSWSSSFPDLVSRGRAAPAGGSTAAPVLVIPDTGVPALSWAPSFPDAAPRARGAPLAAGQAGPVAVLPDVQPTIASWLPALPPWAPPRPRAAPLASGGTPPTLVLPDPVPLSWSPTFPDVVRARALAPSGGLVAPVAAIPDPSVPPLSWSPSFPDASARPRASVNVGGLVAPVQAIPNPAAAPLSWSPSFPDASARPRASVNAGGAGAPVAAIPDPPIPPPARVTPAAGRGVAGVTRGSVVKVGGVSRTGGVRVALPSPTGEWNPQWKDNVVDFDRDQFTRFIDDKGYCLVWEKAVLCPNVPGTGLSPHDHVIGCPICGGVGFIYVDPIPTKMLMQGVKLNQSFYAYGRWDMGNMLVTAEPEFNIDYFDRLTLGNGVGRFTQRLVRRPGTATDALKYAPLCLRYVAWVDRSGALAQFELDVDFRVSADGSSIEWSGASQPDANSFYTVSYDYRPRYVVLDLVHHHRDSTVEGQHYQFPVQAMAKLDYLVRNESADARQVVDKNPFQ